MQSITMMSLRTISLLSRSSRAIAAFRPRNAAAVVDHKSRCLSAAGAAAVCKFKTILEKYRQENYAYELESRFKKEVVGAAITDNDKKNCSDVDLDGIMKVIHNIGADQQLSCDDVQLIIDELGDGNRISINGMMKEVL